jgi:RNA-splicing ligase RtcB
MSVTGKTLIDLGYKPSKWFKSVIEHANENNLGTEELVAHIKSIVPEVVEPLDRPIPFHRNIVAEDEGDQSNIDAVCSAMNGILTLPTVVDAAIMPDACPTGPNDIPVGGIVATRNSIHPSMHSADICCSMMVTDMGSASPGEVLSAAFGVTHFGPGGRTEPVGFLEELESEIRSNPYLNSERSIHFARSHFATQGDGNHFLFVGTRRSDGRTVMVTHHGSRGFGANLYKKGLVEAEFFRKEISPNSHPKHPWIPYDTAEGKAYWDALQIVRKWTKANHMAIHEAVSRLIGANDPETFWNEHNFVFRKGEVFYHAKGATPLDDAFVPDSHNGLRLIPMNMRDGILVVRGETTETNLGFAPHGAGRNLSRSQHRRLRLNGKTKEQVLDEETLGLDIRFFSGEADITELPSAYKDAGKVKRQIESFGLGSIVDEIEPHGCIMAGEQKWSRK